MPGHQVPPGNITCKQQLSVTTYNFVIIGKLSLWTFAAISRFCEVKTICIQISGLQQNTFLPGLMSMVDGEVNIYLKLKTEPSELWQGSELSCYKCYQNNFEGLKGGSFLCLK